MRAILAIALKDLRLLSRDRGAAFFVFLFPIIVALFFGAIFSTGYKVRGAMDIAVVDLDGGAAAARFVEDLSATGGLRVTRSPSRADAEKRVREGTVAASVIVPLGFQDDMDHMLVGRPLRVEAVTDPRHAAEAGLLTGKLNEAAFRQLARAFSDPARMSTMVQSARDSVSNAQGLDDRRRAVLENFFGSMRTLSESGVLAGPPGAGRALEFKPVDVTVSEITSTRDVPQSSFEVSYPQGTVWGLMGCVAGFGASLAHERSRGTLTRLAIAPITRSQILLGKALACFIACLLVQLLLLGLALALKVRPTAWGLTAVVMILNGVAFTGLMMLMAGLSRTAGAAEGLGRALIIILAMIGGGTVPIFFMPEIMQTFSNISPFKWATFAIEGTLWRAFTPRHMLPYLAVLALFGVVGYTVGAAAFRWSDAK